LHTSCEQIKRKHISWIHGDQTSLLFGIEKKQKKKKLGINNVFFFFFFNTPTKFLICVLCYKLVESTRPPIYQVLKASKPYVVHQPPQGRRIGKEGGWCGVRVSLRPCGRCKFQQFPHLIIFKIRGNCDSFVPYYIYKRKKGLQSTIM
jgi:hypothetical protein